MPAKQMAGGMVDGRSVVEVPAAEYFLLIGMELLEIAGNVARKLAERCVEHATPLPAQAPAQAGRTDCFDLRIPPPVVP